MIFEEENSTENSTKKSIEKPMKNEVKENEEYKGDLTFKIWRKYVEENKYPKAFILQVLKQAKSILSKRPAVMDMKSVFLLSFLIVIVIQ